MGNQEPLNNIGSGNTYDDDDGESDNTLYCSWTMVDCMNFTDYSCDDKLLSISVTESDPTQVLRKSSSNSESDDQYSLRSLVVLTVAGTFVVMTLCVVCVVWECYGSSMSTKFDRKRKKSKSPSPQHAAEAEASNPGTVYAAVARDADRSSSQLDAHIQRHPHYPNSQGI